MEENARKENLDNFVVYQIYLSCNEHGAFIEEGVAIWSVAIVVVRCT